MQLRQEGVDVVIPTLSVNMRNTGQIAALKNKRFAPAESGRPLDTALGHWVELRGPNFTHALPGGSTTRGYKTLMLRRLLLQKTGVFLKRFFTKICVF